MGKALACNEKEVMLDVRNKFSANDTLEILSRRGPSRRAVIHTMTDMDHVPINPVQPGDRVRVVLSEPCEVNDLLRIKEKKAS